MLMQFIVKDSNTRNTASTLMCHKIQGNLHKSTVVNVGCHEVYFTSLSRSLIPQNIRRSTVKHLRIKKNNKKTTTPG